MRGTRVPGSRDHYPRGVLSGQRTKVGKKFPTAPYASGQSLSKSLKSNGSGGGTRNPDTRIMIPVRLAELPSFYVNFVQDEP
jgi:hypothetical protein